jgi:hypothetical protein
MGSPSKKGKDTMAVNLTGASLAAKHHIATMVLLGFGSVILLPAMSHMLDDCNA